MTAILNIGRYFTKAILAKMKTKPLSRITYAYPATTKCVAIEK